MHRRGQGEDALAPRERKIQICNCIKDGANATKWNTPFSGDNRKGQRAFGDYGSFYGGNSKAHRLFKVRGSCHQQKVPNPNLRQKTKQLDVEQGFPEQGLGMWYISRTGAGRQSLPQSTQVLISSYSRHLRVTNRWQRRYGSEQHRKRCC